LLATNDHNMKLSDVRCRESPVTHAHHTTADTLLGAGWLQQRRLAAKAMSDSSHLYVGLPQADAADAQARFQKRRFALSREKIPWHPVCTGIFLLVIGMVFLPLGMWTIFEDYDRGVSFIALGTITMIPGGYGSFIFFSALFGRRGYRYSHIPGQYQ